MARRRTWYNVMSLLIDEYCPWITLLLLPYFCGIVVNGLQSNAPFFQPRENNVSFHVGEKATLLCAVLGLQTRYVVWRRMSEPTPLTIGDFVYSSDQRISIRRVEEKHEWNLIIKNIQPSDAGVYECSVSSREKYKRLVLLRVEDGNWQNRTLHQNMFEHENVNMDSKIVISGKDFVSKGHSIVLWCNATGEDFAPDGVDWFINGHKVSTKTMPRVQVNDYVAGYKRTLYSRLEVPHSVMDDKGMYVCRGPDTKTASITIHILDEEKSSLGKRGEDLPYEQVFEDNPNSSTSSLNRDLTSVSISNLVWIVATWFTHVWFIT